ncbi:hypothetical protein LZ31DRAFT_452741, partial [Colletotrichum somersetense]
ICYQTVELYEARRGLYYQQVNNRSAAWGRRGHSTQKRTPLVGYVCPEHAGH